MKMERYIDEDGKVVVKLINDNNKNYNGLRMFKKDFIDKFEHKVIKESEHTYVFQVPRMYDSEWVYILFHSDLHLFNTAGECEIYEYRWLIRKEN